MTYNVFSGTLNPTHFTSLYYYTELPVGHPHSKFWDVQTSSNQQWLCAYAGSVLGTLSRKKCNRNMTNVTDV